MSVPFEELPDLESALRMNAEQLIAARVGDDEDSWERALVRLTVAAASSVPGATFVGMTMRGAAGELVSQAPSHDEIVWLDRAQADLGEGPCVEAVTPETPKVIRVDSFAAETRWPRFAALAVDAGVHSLLSYALAPHGAPPGALNIYGRAPHAFGDQSQMVAGIFAMQAAVAAYGASRVAQIHRALETRDVIGQAKGILMERFRLDDQRAFDLLVRSSQDTNIKLVDVARWTASETARLAANPSGAGAPARSAPAPTPGDVDRQ